MCCCGKPVVNGELGYRWNNPDGSPSVYPVNPPELSDGDVLIYDEPGRCGGLDSHSHHYRVVRRAGSGGLSLLVRHGGGDERIYLSGPIADILNSLDSNKRYWMLNAIYHAYSGGDRQARSEVNEKWRTAAIEKRIKTRRTKTTVKVWIEPKEER